ncbi:inositol polyphosphate-4-phosphatase, partial [Clonorchis sinensis]
FSEHWCRLKGNILVLCRSPDRKSTEVEGVILLERFTVATAKEEDIPHAFRIEFDAGDPAVVFIARSETEAEIWCQHLVAAQLAPTLQRIGLIRDELRNSTGRDPLDSGLTTIHEVEKPSVTDEGSSDLKGIEISLSCRDLAWEPESTPNAHIILSLCTPPDSGWKRVGTTEVVEKSSNPTFMKTIYLRSEPLNEKTRLQLELVDLRDMKSELGIRLGVVVTTVNRITEGEALELSVCDASTGLALKSPLNGKTPKVIIQARRCHQPSDAAAQV